MRSCAHRHSWPRHQCLDLDEERAAALQEGGDRAARHLVPALGGEQRSRVGQGDEAGGGHLEEAELAGRPEAVLHGPREAEPVVPVALEGEDGVDQVLQGARPGRVALFRDVPDDHDGRPRGAGGLTQLLDHGPDLRQAPRRPGAPAARRVWIESRTTERADAPRWRRARRRDRWPRG